MRYHSIGNTDIKASVVGFGAWAIGGGVWWGQEPSDDESISAVHAALAAGVTLIDTAPAYGFGRSEEIVGRAIRGQRDKVVIATKCGLWWKDQRGAKFIEIGDRPLNRCLRPDTIAVEIEDSLRRLDTDYIDLYQTHWPAIEPELTPIADTMACLLKLKDAGKIRAIGVCNVTPAELEAYMACGPVASDQFRYSMLHRVPEADILPLCQKKQLATLTYMSLEQGLLTGKVGMDRVFSKDEFRSNADWNPWYKPENRRRILNLLAQWRPLTEQYRCSQAALTVAWTLAQSGVTHVLCGGRRAQQITETAAAADLAIAPEDIQRMGRDIESLGKPR